MEKRKVDPPGKKLCRLKSIKKTSFVPKTEKDGYENGVNEDGGAGGKASKATNECCTIGCWDGRGGGRWRRWRRRQQRRSACL